MKGEEELKERIERRNAGLTLVGLQSGDFAFTIIMKLA